MGLIILQLLSCTFMTGLIWTIQILHYPAFASVQKENFAKFHSKHSRDITFIVGPIMVLEFVTALILILDFPTSLILWCNGLLVLLIWASTFFLSVPLHNVLSKAHDLKVVDRLVSTNWYRTILWSARVPMLFYFFLKTLEVEYVRVLK